MLLQWLKLPLKFCGERATVRQLLMIGKISAQWHFVVVRSLCCGWGNPFHPDNEHVCMHMCVSVCVFGCVRLLTESLMLLWLRRSVLPWFWELLVIEDAEHSFTLLSCQMSLYCACHGWQGGHQFCELNISMKTNILNSKEDWVFRSGTHVIEDTWLKVKWNLQLKLDFLHLK